MSFMSRWAFKLLHKTCITVLAYKPSNNQNALSNHVASLKNVLLQWYSTFNQSKYSSINFIITVRLLDPPLPSPQLWQGGSFSVPFPPQLRSRELSNWFSKIKRHSSTWSAFLKNEHSWQGTVGAEGGGRAMSKSEFLSTTCSTFIDRFYVTNAIW